MDRPYEEPVQVKDAVMLNNGTAHVRSTAPIERLPVELIQKIFFDCLELNFPRASLEIADALSDPVIYTWLIRLAFSSCNESSKAGFFVPTFVPLDYFALNPKQRAKLQSDVLECRWCTLPLLRKCQRQYVEHVLQTKCAHLKVSTEDQKRISNLDELWHTANFFDTASRGRRGKGDLVMCATDTTDGTQRKIAIWFNFGAVQISEPSPVFLETDVFQLPLCSFAEPCRMPDKLLRPPWTEEKLEMFTLLSTEAYVDETSAFERSKVVLRQVILDRDIKTFERFLCMQIRVRVYGYPLRWPVRPNHFRIAARCAKSHPDPFLFLLFTRRRDDVPSDDPALRALASRYHRMI